MNGLTDRMRSLSCSVFDGSDSLIGDLFSRKVLIPRNPAYTLFYLAN
jgi:hypothetical protein